MIFLKHDEADINNGYTARLCLHDLASYNLTKEIEKLQRPCPNDPESYERYLHESRLVVSQNLTKPIKYSLQRMVEADGLIGLQIDGLYGGTDLATSEGTLLGLSGMIGKIFGYKQEKSGALIHNVKPKKGREKVQANDGRTDFGAHVDNAILASPFRCDWICLYGIESQEEVPTYLLPLPRILEQLCPRDIKLLQEPLYQIAQPHSFEMNAVVQSLPRPILFTNAQGIFEVAAATYNVKPVSEEAAVAFAAFSGAVANILEHRAVYIKPGTFFCFNNKRALHARKAFTGKRFLKRVYLTRDLQPLHEATQTSYPNRVFDLAPLILK